MNCFQIVKSVLDELYDRIPGDSSEKDKKITKMMRKLEENYSRLSQGAEIDYSDITTRFAYIYKYVTSHANLVFQIISKNNKLKDLFKEEKVNITCIGGGPGSDFLGVLKYIMVNELNPFLRCTLFDGEQSWGECWSDVDEKLGMDMRISTFFQPFDVCDYNTYCDISKYLGSDLFTLVYFMSEVYQYRESADAFFSNLLRQAKTGALLLYIDNKSSTFYNWFDELIFTSSWKILKSDELTMSIDDFSEEKKDLGIYWEKFSYPKLKADIAFRICLKN